MRFEAAKRRVRAGISSKAPCAATSTWAGFSAVLVTMPGIATSKTISCAADTTIQAALSVAVPPLACSKSASCHSIRSESDSKPRCQDGVASNLQFGCGIFDREVAAALHFHVALVRAHFDIPTCHTV